MIIARKLYNRGGTDILKTRGSYKKDVYQRFVEWYVLEDKQKKEMDLLTQKDFAEKYGINVNTLSLWKATKVFKDNANEEQMNVLDARSPNAWGSFMRRLEKYGYAYEMEVYLAYVKGWDRKQIIEFANELQLTKGDIRALVDKLPTDKQHKFYDTLVDLIDEAQKAGIDVSDD